jgi:hypothetical protein
MVAADHPRGRGPDAVDTHEVVEATLDGRDVILDAMTNTVIPHSLDRVLADPSLATPKLDPDDRYRARRYDYYDTSFWYSRVARYRSSRRYLHRLPVWRRR